MVLVAGLSSCYPALQALDAASDAVDATRLEDPR